MGAAKGKTFQVNTELQNEAASGMSGGLAEAAAGVLLCGALFVLLGGTGAECHMWLLALLVLLLAAVMCGIRRLPPLRGSLSYRTGLAFGLPPMLLVCILAAAHKEALNGFWLLVNALMETAGRFSGRIVPVFPVDTDISAPQAADVFSICAVLLFWLPAAASVAERRRIAPGLLTAAVLGVGIISGAQGWQNAPELLYTGSLLLLLFWSWFLPVCHGVREQNGTCSRASRWQLIQGALALLTVGLSAGLFYGAGLSSAREEWEEFGARIRYEAERTADTLRYGSGYVLPEGDFSRLGSFSPQGTPQLEVVMQTPDSYYLRGFVGGVYTGSGWEQQENWVRYESAALFYWLHADGFYGQTQMAALTQLLGLPQTQGRMIVRNVGASPKYIYAPYEVLSAEASLLSASEIGDEALCASGWKVSRSYRYTVLDNQVGHYTAHTEALYAAETEGDGSAGAALALYLNDEAHYNEYVYASYLDVPETVQHIFERLLGAYEPEAEGEMHLSYALAKQRILNCLSELTYDTEAGAPEDGRDFTSYFLEETGRGYSVHFATAAVLMFRYYGIPARYVEGYLITPSDAAGVLPDSAVLLDDTHAHAWAEIYQDGVGWIPFEATPAYFNIMEQADELEYGEAGTAEIPPSDGEAQEDTAASSQGMDEMLQILRSRLLPVLAAAIAAVLAALCVAALWLVWKRHRQRRRLLAAFADTDLRAAVLAMFAYCVRLLYRTGVFSDINAVYTRQEAVAVCCGEEYAALFYAAYAVYEAARFSREPIEAQQRDVLREFVSRTEQFARERKRSAAGGRKKG